MIIVYKGLAGSVSILIPSPECLLDHELVAIALKDVPDGLPYWIVEEPEIPVDRTFREAWEVPEDWGPPDGYGSEFCTFEEIEDAQDKQ
ncbi:hypothetical protein [Sphaerochaeta sp. PS]|uniref:hypothetical protein n=1 Tax=Sphaerochaeta sp. PS TaxID=3076336 RepID=UPI0028A4EFA9|nr:hypothetical protein [Sphaerochaeta sp. PS]MDT4761813.1 hypothetical protein [Sphaerochaeta sp. PS]